MSTVNNTRAYESVSFGVQQKAQLELHVQCRCQSFDRLCVQGPINCSRWPGVIHLGIARHAGYDEMTPSSEQPHIAGDPLVADSSMAKATATLWPSSKTHGDAIAFFIQETDLTL